MLGKRIAACLLLCLWLLLFLYASASTPGSGHGNTAGRAGICSNGSFSCNTTARNSQLITNDFIRNTIFTASFFAEVRKQAINYSSTAGSFTINKRLR